MLDFHPDVAEQYLRLDLDAWDDVYVVGDVHGCRESLDRLLGTLDIGEEDLVVFVGDLIRKGPDSAGVVELLRDSPNMYSVRGNNEEKVLRGETVVEGLDEDHREWLRSLPVAIGFDGGLVVPAGAPGSTHGRRWPNTRSMTSRTSGRCRLPAATKAPSGTTTTRVRRACSSATRFLNDRSSESGRSASIPDVSTAGH